MTQSTVVCVCVCVCVCALVVRVAKRCPLIWHLVKLTVPESYPDDRTCKFGSHSNAAEKGCRSLFPVPQTLWLGTLHLHAMPALKMLVTWCTNSLTFNNCVRSAHAVFMCFLLIWEQTSTCATYSINWLVFITEMKSVYSAVRTGSLNKAVCGLSLTFWHPGFTFKF